MAHLTMRQAMQCCATCLHQGCLHARGVYHDTLHVLMCTALPNGLCCGLVCVPFTHPMMYLPTPHQLNINIRHAAQDFAPSTSKQQAGPGCNTRDLCALCNMPLLTQVYPGA